MTQYVAVAGITLLTGVTDPNQGASGPPKVWKVNEVVPSSWPVTVDLVAGVLRVIINEDGTGILESVSDANNPANNQSGNVPSGTFTCRMWSGVVTTTPPPLRTVTLGWTGKTTLVNTGHITDGLVLQATAAAGVTASAGVISAFVDQVSSRAMTLVGSPTTTTSPGGSAGVGINIAAAQGFTFDPTGLPVGAADRTMFFSGIFNGTSFKFGGLGYGTNAAFQAFTLGVDDTGRAMLDYGGNQRGLMGLTPTNIPAIMWAKLSGGVITFGMGKGVYGTTNGVTLNTVLTRGNIMRSFSNNTTTGKFFYGAIYNRALSQAEVEYEIDLINAEFFGDTTVVAPGAPTLTTGTLTGNSYTADEVAGENYGLLRLVAKNGTSAPTRAEIEAGTGFLASLALALNNSPNAQINVAGLTSGQTSKVHAVFYDTIGGVSSVVSSASITTTGADLTPAAVTFPSGKPAATGTTTADIPFVVDKAVDWVRAVYKNTATPPNSTQLRANPPTDGNGNPLAFFDSGVTTAGGTVPGTAINLTPSFTYRETVHVLTTTGVGTLTNAGTTFQTQGVPATIPEQVDGLASGLTPVGRTSNNTLKTPGQLPAGASLVTINGYDTIQYTADNVTLADFNFSGLRVDFNNRVNCRLEQCLVDPVITGPGGTGNSPSVIQIPIGSTGFYIGYIRMHKTTVAVGKPEGAFISHEYVKNGTQAAGGGTIERVDMKGYSNDGVHLAGNGVIFRWSKMGLPYQASKDLVIYDGTPGHYTTGDVVAFNVGGNWYVCICNATTPTIGPINGGNAQWNKPIPHTDYINSRASFGSGTLIQAIYSLDEWVSLVSGGGIRVFNVNDWFRIVRNSGETQLMGPIRVEYCRNTRVTKVASAIIEASAGSQPNFVGPFDFEFNRFSIPQNGKFWQSSTAQIGLWNQNTNPLTGATIPQP